MSRNGNPPQERLRTLQSFDAGCGIFRVFRSELNDRAAGRRMRGLLLPPQV
jgi:hypothetical protein